MLKGLLVDRPAKALCSVCRLCLSSRDGSEGINNDEACAKQRVYLSLQPAPTPSPSPCCGPWLIFFVERYPVLSCAVKYSAGQGGRRTGKSPYKLR